MSSDIHIYVLGDMKSSFFQIMTCMLFHSKWHGLNPSSVVFLFLFTGLKCQNASKRLTSPALSVFEVYVTIIFPSITMELENGGPFQMELVSETPMFPLI